MSSDENILGRNIKHLRELNGDKQEELAEILFVTKSAISDYESGRRKPDSIKLGLIAGRYGKTVDELLNVKFYELEKVDTDKIVDYDRLINLSSRLFPIVESPKAYKNAFFSNGMKKIKKVFNSLEADGNGELLCEAMDDFQEAIMSDVPEAYVNMLCCIFLVRASVQADPDYSRKIHARLISNQVTWKELMYETKKNERKVSKMEGLEDLDALSLILIQELKTTKEWAQVGDYYLALRYIFKMADTGESDAMNHAVGMQMMMSFAQIGNKYAIGFIKTGMAME